MSGPKISLVIAVCIAVSCDAAGQQPIAYVDPNIGTAHSRWFFYTPAAVPHGMAKLAPSTNAHYGNPSGWEAVGYDVRHHSIEGFVHFHEWQVGGISFMPATGELKVRPGDLDKPGSGYRSQFDRKNEIAQPGYYKVLLDDYNITAELTATKHVGFHRYTFPSSNAARIVLDIGNRQGESGEVKDASIRMIDDTHFEGFVTTYPRYVEIYDPNGSVSMYFWGEVSKKPKAVGAFSRDSIFAVSTLAKGKGAGLFLEYSTKQEEAIEIKVGLSYTSTKNAKANLVAEANRLSFGSAKAAAQSEWNAALSRIRIDDTSLVNKVKFYTGLYHALLGRGIANDVNGDFPRHDGSIGKLPVDSKGRFTYSFYNTDAIWGAYWNLTQLWALSYPEKYNDYVQTQLEIYKERGWFADGVANSNFVSGVGTNFVGLAIAAAYQVGIRNYDVNLAYKAIRANELEWRHRKVGAGKMDVKAFVEKGYSPYLEEDRTDSTGSHYAASHTLEYAFSTFAAAQMAEAMGRHEDYKLFIGYSNGWKQLYDSTLRLMRPKMVNGKFIDHFDSLQAWRGFQEGNAVQYSFFVPQNPAALIHAIGKDEFNRRLENIFDTAQKLDFGGGKEIDAFAGIKSLYNHGNQPNLHISWLFNFSGKPWLTQKWTRAICDGFYGSDSIHGYGYGQDEDQGQLGAWYVMAALGLFDVKGFTDLQPIVQFGSPLFKKATISLGNGKQLIIETRNNSNRNVFVQSVLFNKRPLPDCWMYRDELMKGGKLIFTMGDQPNSNWGAKQVPPSNQ